VLEHPVELHLQCLLPTMLSSASILLRMCAGGGFCALARFLRVVLAISIASMYFCFWRERWRGLFTSIDISSRRDSCFSSRRCLRASSPDNLPLLAFQTLILIHPRRS